MHLCIKLMGRGRIMKEIQTDVLVLGGGTAGCFAAVAAAKNGAETLIIEKNGILGGTMTAGRVNFPGLFFAWGKQIISGPCWEAVLRCERRGGAKIPPIAYCPRNHWEEQILLDIFTYACVLDELCAESGVKMLLHAMAAQVEEKNDCIEVTVAAKEGLLKVKAQVLIDATGDADGVRLAGYACIKSPVLQPATLINDIAGYDIRAVDPEAFEEYVRKAVEQGWLFAEDTQGGSFYHQLSSGRISMHVSCKNAETSEGKTELEISARRTLARIIGCLKKFHGLEGIFVSSCAVECGVRETCRIIGEDTVTAEDYLAGKIYEDALCYCFYPIDLHQPTGIKQIFLQEGRVPMLPYRAMIPKNAQHILAAGRCISSDTDANSAIRVQATCMASGQAAGAAAAIAAKQKLPVKEISVGKIRQALKGIGAIVPYKDF